MVSYSEQALMDIEAIFWGLLAWKTQNGQVHMSYDEVLRYRNDIRDVCNSLDSVVLHTPAKYSDHTQYGLYVFRYRRNKRTQWYIIYNVQNDCVCIEKIMNNYQTVSEIDE